MKRILCSLLVATLPLSSVLAAAPQSKNAKVTLVYEHELPNVPGKSLRAVLVEYGPPPGHGALFESGHALPGVSIVVTVRRSSLSATWPLAKSDRLRPIRRAGRDPVPSRQPLADPHIRPRRV
jgi:hypothetical protein